jgi:hypothetical protein
MVISVIFDDGGGWSLDAVPRQPPLRMSGMWKRAMVEPVRHSQTKETGDRYVRT